MNALMLISLFVPVLAIQGDELRVTLLDEPVVRHVMLHSQTSYWGNDVEIAQMVEVVDEEGRPAAGKTVSLTARTRDGRIARVRAVGVTGASGRATVRAIFEVASSDMVVSLQACVLATDYCSPLSSADLKQRITLDFTTVYATGATVGDQPLTLNGSSRVLSTVQSSHIVGGKARLEYLLADRGQGWRRLSVSAYGETGGNFAASETVDSVEGPLFVSKSQGLLPMNAAGGISAIISRIALDAMVARHARQLTLQAFQPVADRVIVFGGFTGTASPGSSRESYGSSYGPFAGLAYIGTSGRYHISAAGAWMQWDSSTILTSSNNRVFLPKKNAADINLSWDYHRGGPVHVKLFGAGSGLGAGPVSISTGVHLTFRNVIARLP